jgi:hypothetical protein
LNQFISLSIESYSSLKRSVLLNLTTSSHKYNNTFSANFSLSLISSNDTKNFQICLSSQLIQYVDNFEISELIVSTNLCHVIFVQNINSFLNGCESSKLLGILLNIHLLLKAVSSTNTFWSEEFIVAKIERLLGIIILSFSIQCSFR